VIDPCIPALCRHAIDDRTLAIQVQHNSRVLGKKKPADLD
jgi:hypothetical protein